MLKEVVLALRAEQGEGNITAWRDSCRSSDSLINPLG